MGGLAALVRDCGRLHRRAGGDQAGPDTFQPAALLSLTAALCYALYSIATRVLARTDSNHTTLFYSNLVGAVALIPVVPFVWTTPSDPLVIALMVVAQPSARRPAGRMAWSRRTAPPE